jgi:hypothetical protein
MLCDKSRTTTVDKLLQQFILHEVEDEKGNKTYPVEFTGDAETLRQDQLLIKIDVSAEVEFLIPEVKQAAEKYVASIKNDYQKIQGPLTTACKNCEYRLPLESTDKNGFLECWEERGRVIPHLLELRNLGNLKSSKEKLADTLFAKGKASLYDIPTEWLSSEKQGAWQKRQIEYTKKGEEWISPDLKNKLSGYKYPLQFIDFETSRMVLPYHKGMRPYGQVAFQWSCHTIESCGMAPKHQEWINTDDSFPNIEFAKSLMACLGRSGTIFMWSHHERSVLKEIARQIKEGEKPFPELVEWLEWMDRSLVDQCKIATDYYYHPDMKGSVSIKYVLPAIWNNNPSLHEIEYFKPYFKNSNGHVVNPYETLNKIEIAKEAEVIKQGTGAIRAYEEMMYGLHREDFETHQKWTGLLRQYCELDTMAMVIVYGYWCSRVGIGW